MTASATAGSLPFTTGHLASLGPLDVFALAAGAMLSIIAVSQWVASYYTDRLALRLFALRYAIAAAAWLLVHPQAFRQGDELPLPPMIVAVGLLCLHSVAQDVYFWQVQPGRLRRQLALAVSAVVLIVGWHRIHPTDPSAIYLVMGAWMLGLAWQAWRANQRERNAGHLLIALASLSYPVFVVAVTALQGSVRRLELSYVAVIPSAIMGVAVLVGSLVRFGHRLEAALQQVTQGEQRLRELNTTLEERVASRTADLRQVIEGLESFTRNVSHDLRSPLAGMAGVARLAEEQLAAGDAQRSRPLLAALATQADQLAELVRDLMTLSRVGEGEVQRVEQPLDRVLDSALQQLAQAPDSAPLVGRVQLLREPLPHARVDATLMQQVFVNLVGNALRFAAHGGAAVPQVRIGVEGQGAAACIFVADNGPGIPEGGAMRLFSPFTCLHGRGLSRNGIGLSIVQRVIERHRGRVWAANGHGGGAVFRFQVDALAG